jgi:hypothetical protein
MPSPEQRFEVPPEYAEVYERAYRRAYEEGQGQLNRGADPSDPPVRRRDRGKRVAPPSQGSSHRAVSQPRGAPWSQQWSAQRSRPSSGHRSDGRSGGPVPKVVPRPPVVRRSGTRVAGRAKRRRANSSTIAPLAGLMLLGVALLVAAFLLGRWTVSCMTAAASPGTGTRSGATASASASASPSATDTGQVGIPPPVPSGPFRGPLAPVRIASASAGCTAPDGRDASNHLVSYAAGNVLDGRLVTAWRCGGAAIGQQLVLSLAHPTQIVRVGLVPGYAKTDPADGTDRYAQNNRITKVAWLFDGGHRVVQSMSGSATDRSLRTMRIHPVRASTVLLRVLAVEPGPRDTTMVSTVRLDTSGAGAD